MKKILSKCVYYGFRIECESYEYCGKKKIVY